MAAINNGDDADATIDFTSVIPAEGEFNLDNELYMKNNDGEMKEYRISNISEVAYELTPVNDDDGEKVTVTFDCTKTDIHPIYAVDVSGKSHDVVEVNPNPNEVNLFEQFGIVFAVLGGEEDEQQYVRISSIATVKGDDSKFKCKIYGGKRNKSVKVSTVFVDVNSSLQQPNKIVTDDNDEPTLEDCAKSGCKKCKNELETGKKTTAKHTPSCPRSKQSKTARESEKKKSQKKSSSNNKEDDYSDKSGVNSDDDDLSDAESEEVTKGDGLTRAQRADNRNNSTGGNNLGRGNKNSRPRDKSPTSNSSRNRTTNPAAKRQRKQTGGGKRLSNNNSGGAAAATAAPPVISISNGENTPRNNQNGLTSHGIGIGIGSGQGGGAGLVDSTLRGSISTSNGSSTMDMPPNPNNKLFVEIEQG